MSESNPLSPRRAAPSARPFDEAPGPWSGAFAFPRAAASLLPIVVATTALIGCSSTTQLDGIELQLSEVQAQLRQLQREASSKDEVTSLGVTVQEDTATLLRAQADLRDEVRQLGARLDALGDGSTQNGATLQQVSRRLDALVQSVEALQDLVEQHDATSPALSTIDASNPERLYQAAYDDFLRANYDLALAGFRRFLEVFPLHNLADNALYWIGECYFSRGEYAAAIREFEDVARRFPSSDRLATTLLRQAGAWIELGDRGRARTLLEDVVRRFPNSDEAVLAQQQLRTVGG